MTQGKGRYVYGIAAGKGTLKLGAIGVEHNEVYTIPYKELCAIVHNCPAAPYQTDDDGTVKLWLKTHHSVLEEARRIFDTIIPLGFDCILQPKDDAVSPNQVVRNWLKTDYAWLRALMQKIQGRDEYVVQVSYQPTVIGKQLATQNIAIKEIMATMTTKSPGTAYMYKQRLERAVKAETERLANEWFQDLYGRLKCHCDALIVEQTKKTDKDKVMLLNLSCLVARERVDHLGEELEKINGMDGFSVHFSGPWPPYSFAAKPLVPAKGE